MSLKFSSFVIWKILNSFVNPHMVGDMCSPHALIFVYSIRQQKTQKKFRLFSDIEVFMFCCAEQCLGFKQYCGPL